MTIPAGCGSGIHVSLDPILIRVAEARKATIKWQLPKESPWSFTSAGINIINFDGAAFERRPTGASKEYQVTNIPAKPGVYKYDINLERTIKDEKGEPRKETCTLDPTVVNW